jgi:hypothetical protein
MNTGKAMNTTTYKWHDVLARMIMQQLALKCCQYTGHILIKGVGE